MKLLQLALNDILKLLVATEVILENDYTTETALEKLLGVGDTSNFIKVTLPIGSSFKVLNSCGSQQDRRSWNLELQVLDWPPLLIEGEVCITIPIDEFNKIDWCEVCPRPEPIILEAESEETESSDNLDFSHIK